jgi:hypothetical protein
MARKYYTLVTREAVADKWAPQFGDYDRECVEQEVQDSYLTYARQHRRIICTAPGQADIDAAVAKLNA